MKYLNLSSSGSKLENVTCKFTKNRSPSHLLFKEFHYKCRTAILKNASWWLLLRATLFWKYSWTAAFQRQLQSIFILKILNYKYLTFLTLTSCKRRTNFYGFFLSSGFDEKCKQRELSLNFIQKQYFSQKSTFPLHYSWIATPWTSKKLFLKFSSFKGTLRP